jgi:hypothetical protein
MAAVCFLHVPNRTGTARHDSANTPVEERRLCANGVKPCRKGAQAAPDASNAVEEFGFSDGTIYG